MMLRTKEMTDLLIKYLNTMESIEEKCKSRGFISSMVHECVMRKYVHLPKSSHVYHVVIKVQSFG